LQGPSIISTLILSAHQKRLVILQWFPCWEPRFLIVTMSPSSSPPPFRDRTPDSRNCFAVGRSMGSPLRHLSMNHRTALSSKASRLQ
jgi:hypothetical protein